MLDFKTIFGPGPAYPNAVPADDFAAWTDGGAPAGRDFNPSLANHTAMPYEVTGREIIPSEVYVSNGWCDIVPRRTTKPKPNLNVAANVAAYGARTKAFKPTKVEIRIRGGLNIAKTGHVEIVQAIQEAAGLETTQCDGDTICPNLKQIMVNKQAAIVAKKIRDKATSLLRHNGADAAQWPNGQRGHRGRSRSRGSSGSRSASRGQPPPEASRELKGNVEDSPASRGHGSPDSSTGQCEQGWPNCFKNGRQVSNSGGAASSPPLTPLPSARSAEQDQIAALRAQNGMLLKKINELESKINQPLSPPSLPATEVMESELVEPKAATSAEAAFEARFGAIDARFTDLENQISMMVTAISKLQDTIPAMIAQQIAHSSRPSRRPGGPYKDVSGRPLKTSRRTPEVDDDDSCSLSGMEDSVLLVSAGSGAASLQPNLSLTDHGEHRGRSTSGVRFAPPAGANSWAQRVKATTGCQASATTGTLPTNRGPLRDQSQQTKRTDTAHALDTSPSPTPLSDTPANDIDGKLDKILSTLGQLQFDVKSLKKDTIDL
ncbi:hypothetical protein HPB49_006430 [Dermacentor silvarum]|uniref:Uncharacterized protein n=1 Tax=Dermacentor silvarum TaxID=543639 RepID=A0ACB8C7U8_DERSI|nr:hypothetical protein HPB49_006430 [Dermacentor silvarum]